MARPVPIAGPAEGSSSDYADCGTLAGNAWLQAFVATAPGLPTLDNSTASQVAAAINALEIPHLSAIDEYPGDLNAYLAQFPNDGIMAGVRVDGWDCAPNPNGNAEHWIDPYLFDGDVVWFYNCWHATFDATGPNTLQASYQAPGTFVGCVRIIFAPPPPYVWEDTDDMFAPLVIHISDGGGGQYLVDSDGTPQIANGTYPNAIPMTADDYGKFVTNRAAQWKRMLPSGGGGGTVHHHGVSTVPGQTTDAG